MLMFSAGVATIFVAVFFLAFKPLWRAAALQHAYVRTWLILLIGVAVPVIAIYTTIGALPMVWLAP